MSPERLEQRCAATSRLNEIRKLLIHGHLLNDVGFDLMSNEAARLEAELRRKEAES